MNSTGPTKFVIDRDTKIETKIIDQPIIQKMFKPQRANKQHKLWIMKDRIKYTYYIDGKLITTKLSLSVKHTIEQRIIEMQKKIATLGFCVDVVVINDKQKSVDMNHPILSTIIQ